MSSLRDQVLVDAIAAHLAAHPQAADSAEGVTRWWLGAAGLVASVDQVERALATLVAMQRMRQVRLADGSTLYSGIAGSAAPRGSK